MKTIVDSRGINTVPGATSLDVNGDLNVLVEDKLINVGGLLMDLKERIYGFNQGPLQASSEDTKIVCKLIQDDLLNVVSHLNALQEEVKELKNNINKSEGVEDTNNKKPSTKASNKSK